MLSLKLALKFLFSKKKEKFISINAMLAIGSVCVSVLVLIVVIGVMSGFGETLREKILGMTPHLIFHSDTPLYNYEETINIIKKDSSIFHASPYIQGNAVLEHNKNLYGIGVKGILMPEGLNVTRLAKYIKLGTAEINKNEIIIGIELAKTLGVSLNDNVLIHSPGGSFSDEFPGYIECDIKGIYESGLYDLDVNQVFITLSDAKLLYGFKDEVHGIEASVKNYENVANIKLELFNKLPEKIIIRTWIENNKSFFSALKTEKNMMFILLTFAVLIAAINIVSTLVMMTMEKFKDIGILKAIGFSKSKILKIFLWEGIIIGFLGTGIGSILGVLFLKYIDYIEKFVANVTGFKVFPEDVYYFKQIPTALKIEDVIIIISMSILISIVASLYPAFKASRLPAIEALKYE